MNREIKIQDSNKIIRCLLTHIQFKENSKNTDTFINFDVTIKNTSSDTISIDLRHLKLTCNNAKSSGPYIQSIASVLIMPQRIIPGQRISEKVYWVFDKRISPQDLDDLKITYGG